MSTPPSEFDLPGPLPAAGEPDRRLRTAAVTMAMLLLAYELRPGAFRPGDLGLSGNIRGLPDLLIETAGELRWLLGMQRADGVLRPLEDPGPPGRCPEANDPAREGGAAGLAAYAGVMAVAARVYRRFAPELARAAWKAVNRTLARLAAQPAGNSRGAAHPGNGCFWAYAEAALTSGLTAYAEAARIHFPADRRITPISWADQTSLGLFAYARAASREDRARGRIREMFRIGAERVAEQMARGADGSSLDREESVRFSCRAELARAVNLLLADHLDPNPRQRRAALARLHSFLGMHRPGCSGHRGAGADPPFFPCLRPAAAMPGGTSPPASPGRPATTCPEAWKEGVCPACQEYAGHHAAPLRVAAWRG